MSLFKARELRMKRANLAKQAEEILTAAGDNAMTVEQRQQFDAIHADITNLKSTIDAIEAQESLEMELAESRGVVAANGDVREVKGDEAREVTEKENRAFSNWLRYGNEGLSVEERTIMAARRAPTEQRAQTVTTTAGGYLIPEGFSNKLEESMVAFGGMRQATTVFSTPTGNTLPWPTVDDTSNSGELLAINTQVTNQDIAYSVINFLAYKYSSKQVLVPVELAQDSFFDIDSHVAGVLGNRIGRITNLHFTTGDDLGKPQGIVTAASSALTAASASVVTADELLELLHSVDPAYRGPGAGWMFEDASLRKLRQLKDGEGRPLWQAGLQQREPDVLLGFPYFVNQDMGSMATGVKAVLFGNLKKYMIRDVKEISVLRLVERYADYHQIGFLAFSRHDGRMLDAGTDPVKCITMA